MFHQYTHHRLHALIMYLKLSLAILVVFSMVVLVVRFFVESPGIINGPSMEPRFIDTDFFWVNKLYYFLTEPQRYDVVQIVNLNDKKIIIKRIVGLPGETVTIKRGHVYIQQSVDTPEILLDEPYLEKGQYTTIPGQNGPLTFTLYAGDYFVMGDNRPDSTDSRHYGPVNRQFIIGRVVGAGKM